jgi:hypothetical protein
MAMAVGNPGRLVMAVTVVLVDAFNTSTSLPDIT